jgi:hypothetical protein
MPEILKKEETIIKIKGEAEGFVVEARITNGELQDFHLTDYSDTISIRDVLSLSYLLNCIQAVLYEVDEEEAGETK